MTMKKGRVEYRCSFCGKTQQAVHRLIAGPGGVYICNECIDLCREIIDEEQAMKERPAPDDARGAQGAQWVSSSGRARRDAGEPTSPQPSGDSDASGRKVREEPIMARAGRYVQQTTGYKAFIPAPLPPDSPIKLEGSLPVLLSRADQALGRLDGMTQILPNPNLFVAMYVRREAVLLFQQPLVNVNLAKDYLGLSYKPANRLIEQVTQAGLLEEITGAQRNRRYRYTSYLALFDESGETGVGAEGTQPAENE